MSEFPKIDAYQSNQSKSLIKRLKDTGFIPEYPLVVKREKDQYVYDIDENKYVDFNLHNGSVIYGHNYKSVTSAVKNALSVGGSGGFLNKFDSRLISMFHQMLPGKNMSFYHGLPSALLSLFAKLKPESVGTNTSFVQSILNTYFPQIRSEIALKTKKYDILFLEPIDFEGNLTEVDPKQYQANHICSFENRSAFHLKYGFVKDLDYVDSILCADTIANGINSAVILSNVGFSGENIPSYIAIAIIESLKLYQRKIQFNKFKFINKNNPIVASNGSIFKIARDISPESLFPYGIILKGNIGFITPLHTEFDLHRLYAALSEKFPAKRSKILE